MSVGQQRKRGPAAAGPLRCNEDTARVFRPARMEMQPAGW